MDDLRLCSLDELKHAVPKKLRAEGRVLAVVRIGGDVYALDGICPHWKGMLAEGKVSVERREIICPLHKFRFNLLNGACVASNKRDPVETFAVRIQENEVFLVRPAGLKLTTPESARQTAAPKMEREV